MHDDRISLDGAGEGQEDITPADARLLRVIDTVLGSDSSGTAAGAHTAPVNVEGALAAVRARIANEERVPEARDNHPLRPTLASTLAVPIPARQRMLSQRMLAQRMLVLRSWSRPLGGLAAAAALVLAVGFGAWRMSGSRQASIDTTGAGVGPKGSPGPVYSTAVGVRTSVQLPDGSHVMLAPGSRLALTSDFASSRAVELEGAAFFDVKHDAAHPFTVRSNGAEVRDVGTAFSVNTDARGGVVVAVTEGVVALRGAATTDAPVELRAGDRGVIVTTGPESAITVQRGTVTAANVAWTRGELTYRDTPLREVQADLRRWFGIELETADASLGNRTLTASLRADSAGQALRIIATALGAVMTQKGDTVVLRAGERDIRP